MPCPHRRSGRSRTNQIERLLTYIKFPMLAGSIMSEGRQATRYAHENEHVSKYAARLRDPGR